MNIVKIIKLIFYEADVEYENISIKGSIYFAICHHSNFTNI